MNLPTEQTSRYMRDEDRAPVAYSPPVRSRQGPVLSWDRDLSLDEVTTPATPLYIHEKIHPAEFARSLAAREAPSLFDDFNGLPAKAAFDWYRYQGNWQNRIIRGEARHVMASLLAKESMAGKVQMIYFDPPYGIRFKSNMQADVRNRDVREDVSAIPNDPTLIQAFRDTYRNGIHSYLDNVFRIAAHARELLSEKGSFFLQIGSANVHRLAVLLDEVFGSDNRVATIPFAKSGGTSSNTLPEVADYLLWYARDRDVMTYHQLYEPLTRQEKIAHMSFDAMVELPDGTTRNPTVDEQADPDAHLPEGARLYRRMRLVSPGVSTTGRSGPYEWNGTTYPCPPGEQWRVSPEGMDRLQELGRLDAASAEGLLGWKRYEHEVPGRRIHNLWGEVKSASDLHYIVETSESIVERCMLMTTDPGDLVLDPTCGSGTTALVAERWGRRWITTDCSAVAVSLARQRLATGIHDYFLLQDSPKGAAKERELAGTPSPVGSSQTFGNDPAIGFVYARVPTVSAAILAYDRDEPATLLVNQPIKKRNTVRVSSPFTVESHSPYRVVDPTAMLAAVTSDDTANAQKAIVDALGTTGIRDGANIITVEDIEPYVSGHDGLLTHVGQTTGGKAAIMVAPDDCTVSSHLVNLAAEEAAVMPSVDTLIVIAFAFEPDARSGHAEARGRLTVHKAQANQDLRIGNLQNQAGDHAFVRIGEPAVTIHPADNGDIIVEIEGHDTYDPQTRQLRSGGTDDIHCWMIDADYDGKSFFAHRIHFPGAADDRQIKRFGRQLGRRVDPKLWDSMLTLKSAPLPKPKGGRIAVRIVTNTHTEMTAVREVF